MSVNIVTFVVPPCEICGVIDHTGNKCNMISNEKPNLEDVNYFQKGKPYFNTYNPISRDHPNIFYKYKSPLQVAGPPMFQGKRVQMFPERLI